MVRLTLEVPSGHFCTFAEHDFREPIAGGMHDHDFLECFWVEKGEGFHCINGHKIPTRQGDLFLIRAEDRHAFSSDPDKGMHIVNVAFFAHIWDDFRARYFEGAKTFFSNSSLTARSYHLKAGEIASIQFAARYLRAGSRKRMHVESFLLDVLTLLQETHSWRRGDGVSAPRWIVQACTRLTEDRRFAGGISALSQLAGRSPEHISREFRRHLGRTPTEILNEARMSYAANRLAASDEKITTVALDCGLNNIGHFYRLFYAFAGCTPRRYRLRQQSVLRPDLRGKARRRKSSAA